MATYVFSDIHGHPKPLDRMLESLSPSEDDVFFMLGDMIDRGPDPIGAIRLVRSLPNVTVLMGNHENMMLDCLIGTGAGEGQDAYLSWLTWQVNGGEVTAHGLDALPDAEANEIVDWIKHLPFHARTHVAGRDWLLVHAGIRPGAAMPRGLWTETELDYVLESQSAEDLLWIRDEFWGNPTGYLDEKGHGPVVIAGHTPTPVVERIADRFMERGVWGGRARIMRLGACEATGGVPDRIAIDCGAGSGSGMGRVSMLRLDDNEVFYADIFPGE